MLMHSLILKDFCEDIYTLLCIHTTLEDYKLAFLLNKQLKIHFHKTKNDVSVADKKQNTSFSTYHYIDREYDFEWHLISNSCTQETVLNNNELLQSTEKKTYLINEKKNIDFFIKITGETNQPFISKTVDKINTIQEVVTSYSIDINTLKSKDFLTF
ncbi:MAG: IPExxxVDY family protein [Flavobacteriaceae bacterium]|nr:MAG: IPExxxVDY family protein [Flavobacteriaceae bacterium]